LCVSWKNQGFSWQELAAILICRTVTKITTKGCKDSRLFLASEFAVTLFSIKKGFYRTATVSRRFLWCSARKFELPRSHILILTFSDGNIQILDDPASENPCPYLRVVYDYFYRIRISVISKFSRPTSVRTTLSSGASDPSAF
jgi:hypothetical protein